DTETRQGIWGFIVGKLLSVSMVLVIGFLLLVSLVVSTAIAALNNVLESMFTLPAFCWTILTSIISWMMVSSLFAMIFKVLPDTRVSWRSVWIGAAVSGLLFEVGKTGLGWYLGRESLASAYGAAGSIVLLLMWVYYNSCILFFGAELAHAHAQAGKKKPLSAAQ
ncbi:MAG: YihY/virulence factor BrkB family protein, partial [Verrucomicrobiaceae bacterium]